MTGSERRAKIIKLIQESKEPLSGGALGRQMGVSRQIVVQDIALLRTEGYPILATAKGYTYARPQDTARLIKVIHTNEETEEELNTIVDLGGTVVDVMVNHRIYGRMSASLNIKNRRDVRLFMESIHTGKSSPLMNVTSGYHFHHISAESTEILDEIEEALRKKHFLADFTPYESDTLMGDTQ